MDLTVSEVAQKLGVAEVTARQWARQGRFPNARRTRGGWLVPESDLQNFERPRMGKPKRREEEGDE